MSKLQVSRSRASNKLNVKLDGLLKHWDLPFCPHRSLGQRRFDMMTMVRTGIKSVPSSAWQTQLLDCKRCFAKVTLRVKCYSEGSNGTEKEVFLGEIEIKVVRELGNCLDTPERELFRQLSNRHETRYGKGWLRGSLIEAE